MRLPSITIKSVKGRGFIATDQYGNAKVCKTQADLEEVIDNWAFAQQREGESDNNALAHLMGDPVAEVDNLIDSLTL